MALISIAIASYTRKIDEKKKPAYLVMGNIAFLVGIVIVGAVNQISASADDKAYKKALLEIEVLAKVNEFAIPVFENYADITNNFNSVKNYIYQEQAKTANPNAVTLIERKQEEISTNKSFQKASQALNELKSIAFKLHGLHLQYGSAIPKEVVKWSSIVLKIELENMDQYFDPYAREGGELNESVLNFFDLSGHAFGISIGRARQTSDTIISFLK
jgi:hypothetical protein